MPYKYETERLNYADYAAGSVFYALSGTPTFPLRLAGEMWSRCVAHCAARLRASDRPGPYTLYDPCCGGGYLVSTLAYLHWPDIGVIIASDVDERALSLAEANLSLLTLAGLERRIGQIEQMYKAWGKPSHGDALHSALRLKARLSEHLASHPIETRCFRADVTDRASLAAGWSAGRPGHTVDVVLTDIPYGRHALWQTAHERPVWRMLDALRTILADHTVLAVAADKGQEIAHDQYDRLERFQVGRRQVVLLGCR